MLVPRSAKGSDEKERASRARIFGLVQADLAAYDKAGLGDNASDELQQIVRDLKHNCKSFTESCETMANLYAARSTVSEFHTTTSELIDISLTTIQEG